MKILIEKKARWLTLFGDGQAVFSAPVALGSHPEGPKERQGDGRTPEGRYFVCLKKRGKYGPSLGISYPSEEDARRCGAEEALIACIREREARKERPPWGSTLGGEIFLHGGGIQSDWTAGCVALRDEDAEELYALAPEGTDVEIVP